jgi:hypothetical protein
MKVASRSGFFVFLGGILAARNVVHVRAAFTLQPPPSPNDFADLILPVPNALINQSQPTGLLTFWLPPMVENVDASRVVVGRWS